MTKDGSVEALDDLLRGGLRAVYQPIVRLGTGEVVAYEALLRGPDGTSMASPGAIFAAAAREGRTDEVEHRAVELAISGALDAGLGRDVSLFVNVEGESVGRRIDTPGWNELRERARAQLRIVFEVTERNLLARPDALLAVGEQLREVGWGLAIDDVGAEHAEGIASLPFVRPDIVKLDMSLIQEPTISDTSARISMAVRHHAEESGASVVAEGIEDETHRQRAEVLGADLGQGWLFGRPGPLPSPAPRSSAPLQPMRTGTAITGATPFAIAEARLEMKIASKRSLLAMCRSLEERASAEAPHVAVFAIMQDAKHYVGRTRDIYEHLASLGAVVSVFAVGLGTSPGGQVRGMDLQPGDPLADEWTVVVWGAGYRGALVARDLHDDGPEMDRRFAFAITHDRGLVLELGRCLLPLVSDRHRPTGFSR